MRPDQDDAIGQAITDLTWCATSPHDLEAITSASLGRFPRTRWDHGTTNAQMAADIKREAEDTGGHVGWSDPTADAVSSGSVYAMSHWADTGTAPVSGDSGDDATPTAIDAAIDLLFHSTDELTMLCLDEERIRPASTTTDRLDATIEGLRRLHPILIQARDRMDLLGRNHLDLLVYQHISETATWLYEKGKALCEPDNTKAAQPRPGETPKGCVSCARDRGPDGRAYFEPIDVKNHSKREMCRRCGDYFSGEGKMPPVGAVQYMHRTGKNWTQKIIEEAERSERAS